MSEESNVTKPVSDPKPKVIRGRKNVSGVPIEIANNPKLIEMMARLPKNYDFEIPKTIWRLKKSNAKLVALQFPEGLLMYACAISDILEEFAEVETIIMGDVAYGACCVDDFTAREYGCDFLVHYGHSCLIPIDVTEGINILYVFVDIKIDTLHAIQSIEKNFDKTVPLALISTIQFVSSLQHIASELKSLEYNIEIPRCKPLSPGEVIGCTSPKVKSDIIIFIGDGRFHLESVMIANPRKKFFRYNPYDKSLTEEEYDYEKMLNIRKNAVEQAASCEFFGVIVGTLGRQGSLKVLENIQELLEKNNKRYLVIAMSEISPESLERFKRIEAFVQIACPRLSIDWGYTFDKPLLTPYELVAALKGTEWRKQYPMDFYASKSLGLWTPNHKSVEDEDKVHGSCGNEQFSIEDADKLCGSCEGCSCSSTKIKE